MNTVQKYLLAASTCASFVAAEEPNPPAWDTDRVKILDASKTKDNQDLVNTIFNETGAPDLGGQFIDSRYAILLKKG